LKGRKAWVEGHIEDTNGNVLVEAKSVSVLFPLYFVSHSPRILTCTTVPADIPIDRTMFVQPKYAKLLNSTALRQALGEPEPWKKEPLHLAKDTSGTPTTAV
jgi:inosine-uridine nucleoside N-ribohydrolase